MGESKRRKLLDSSYGQPKLYNVEINGQSLKIRPQVYSGYLNLISETEYLLEMSATDHEIDFIEHILTLTLYTILAKYNHAKIKYKFHFDVSQLLAKRSGNLKIYPAYWDNTPSQMREFRELQIELKPMLENPQPVTERTSPKEHIRKAHQRRVAYGKGRSLRKWVEIPETVVNAP